jgi:hypothetical protein
VRDLRIRDTYVEGGPFQMGTENGDNVDVSWQNVWSHGSSNSGWIINSLLNKNDRSKHNRAIRYSRTDIWSWGHNNGHDRIDAIHDRSGPERFLSPAVSNDPSRIDVTDRNINTSAPVSASSDREFREHPRNPAVVWRRAHPYESYASFLNLDLRSSGTSTGLFFPSTPTDAPSTPAISPSTLPFDFTLGGIAANGVVTGPSAVEVVPVGVGAPTVDFFIDGRPIRSDKEAPYCLEDGSGPNCRRFDFSSLGAGEHKLRVRLRATKGVVERTFVLDVRN